MRWKGRKKSSNVEDRRGQSYSGRSGNNAAIGGIIFSLFQRSGGKTKILLVVGVLIGCFVFKQNPLHLFFAQSNQFSQTHNAPVDPEMAAYLKTMKADNETVWAKLLKQEKIPYRAANMVIYNGRTHTAGGTADARMGPFYMPADETIYIDPTFFQEMKNKFGAKGDFAEAYVIAHEVGHHIQHLTGILKKVHSQRGKISDKEYNKLSVRLELHADFLAGVFAHHAEAQFKFLESGDIKEAINCAEAIGDDRLQNLSHGDIQPDLFTHGTSAQRKRWFMKGFKTGDIHQGDTFSIPYENL